MDTSNIEIIPLSKIRIPKNCVRADYYEAVMEPIDFLSRLPKQSVDLLLSAPPSTLGLSNAEDYVDAWVNKALSSLKHSGRAYIIVNTDVREFELYSQTLNAQSMFTVGTPLMWAEKPPASMRARQMDYLPSCKTIFYLYGPEAQPLKCPTRAERLSHQKARTIEELVSRLICHSTKENDLVVDPFTEDGVCPRVAIELGRRFIGLIGVETTTICKFIHVDAER